MRKEIFERLFKEFEIYYWCKNDEWPTKRPYLMNRKYNINEDMKPYKNDRHEAQAV